MIELTVKQLRRAADLKERIGKPQTKLNRLLGSNAASGGKTVVKRRKMSAAARAKISAAAKARWAKIKGKKTS